MFRVPLPLLFFFLSHGCLGQHLARGEHACAGLSTVPSFSQAAQPGSLTFPKVNVTFLNGCVFVCLCVKAALIERCQCLLLLLLKSVKVFAVVWQIDGEAWCCFASVCFVAHGTSESLSLSVV